MLTPDDLRALMPRLEEFHARFGRFFPRSESRAWSRKYVTGLTLPIERKNVENIAEQVGGSPRRLQEFLSDSPWDDEGCVAVTTQTLDPTGNYVTSYALYDGLLRPRQTQAPSPGGSGGMILTDTFYNTAGQVKTTYGAYYNSGSPSTNLLTPVDPTKSGRPDGDGLRRGRAGHGQRLPAGRPRELADHDRLRR